MDIDYLLLLQDFRNGISNAITPFMEMISLNVMRGYVHYSDGILPYMIKRTGKILFKKNDK